MFFTNEMTVTMINNDAAIRAKVIIRRILEKSSFNDNYAYNPCIKLLEALELNDNVLTLKGEDGYYTPEDARIVFEEIVNALITISYGFVEFESYNEGTYSQSSVKAITNKYNWEVESIYYPHGYCEYLKCPECGEPVVKIEDYDANATYCCPECGKEVDLSDQYDEVAP